MSQAADVDESARAGAIWGMLVGDAYCLGSHWIYDAAAFAERFAAGPAGFDAPMSEHYHAGKLPGALTHYGEGGLILLAALATGNGSADDYGHGLLAFYGRPDHGSYLDKPTRHLLAERASKGADAPFEPGLDDAQNVTTSRLAPLVVRFAGDPRLMAHVDIYTRILQDNDRAVAYACAHARVLEALLGGASLEVALDRLLAALDRRTEIGREIGAGIDAARAAKAEPVAAVSERFGLSCALVKAFPAALHAALAHEDDFASAIAATCAARGDNASRAMLVGSWLGAMHGLDAVPAAWRAKLRDAAQIEAAVDGLRRRRRAMPPLRAH